MRPLRRILGLGFGLAMVFGGTVGVGILRLPGTLAAALGDSHLIILFWVLGGMYALLGAVAVAELVTVISLLTVLSLLNAVLLMTPRILFAIGRDGFFTQKAAAVSASGTPRLALGLSSAAAAALILSGTFEQIVALAAVLFLLIYISAYAALLVLRRREPDLPRPYRAFGFPSPPASCWSAACWCSSPWSSRIRAQGWRRRCCCSPAHRRMPGSPIGAVSMPRRFRRSRTELNRNPSADGVPPGVETCARSAARSCARLTVAAVRRGRKTQPRWFRCWRGHCRR